MAIQLVSLMRGRNYATIKAWLKKAFCLANGRCFRMLAGILAIITEGGCASASVAFVGLFSSSRFCLESLRGVVAKSVQRSLSTPPDWWFRGSGLGY
jgi:hypothetical protein